MLEPALINTQYHMTLSYYAIQSPYYFTVKLSSRLLAVKYLSLGKCQGGHMFPMLTALESLLNLASSTPLPAELSYFREVWAAEHEPPSHWLHSDQSLADPAMSGDLASSQVYIFVVVLSHITSSGLVVGSCPTSTIASQRCHFVLLPAHKNTSRLWPFVVYL